MPRCSMMQARLRCAVPTSTSRVSPEHTGSAFDSTPTTAQSCASTPASAARMANTSTLCSAMSSNSRRSYLLAATAAMLLTIQPLSSQLPTFYPDDPIAIDDDMSLDASKVARVEDSNGYDFVLNTFRSPGVRHNVRAANVNTT